MVLKVLSPRWSHTHQDQAGSTTTTSPGHVPFKNLVYHVVPFGIPNWYDMVYQWYTKLLSKDQRQEVGRRNGIPKYLLYQMVYQMVRFGTVSVPFWYMVYHWYTKMFGIPNGTIWYTKWYYLVYQMVQLGIPNGIPKWYAMYGYASTPPAAGQLIPNGKKWCTK
jgi:hypothetical protein